MSVCLCGTEHRLPLHNAMGSREMKGGKGCDLGDRSLITERGGDGTGGWGVKFYPYKSGEEIERF